MTTEPRVYDATPVFLFDGRTCLCSHADVLTVANPENKLKFDVGKEGKPGKLTKLLCIANFPANPFHLLTWKKRSS